VGDRVRVRPGILRPQYEWGPVTARSVGTILQIRDESECIVNFPEHGRWRGVLSEMVREGEPLPPAAERVMGLDDWMQAAFHKVSMMGFEEEAALAALERACCQETTEVNRLAAAISILVR